ncbi:MAG: hypothetical protein PHC86_07515 [Eubacteriales bacterium]|nr:hypothetical protein [Eubacteriales bacterium]
MRQNQPKKPHKPHLHVTHRRLSAVFFYLAILIGVMISFPIMVTPSPSFADLNPKMQPIPPAATVAAGVSHSVQLDYDGLVYVWGDNAYSQLGMDVGDHTDTPTYLEMPEPAAAVAAGAYHTLVLGRSGTVYAFGRNAFGQIGNGEVANVASPDVVPGLPIIQAIAAGAYHSLALGIDGSVWAWGNNTQQQVGEIQSEQVLGLDGEIIALRNTHPVQIVKEGATAIAAGGNFSLYIDLTGQLFAWGDNSKGQLGDGSTVAHGTPALVTGVNQISAIAAGYEHVLAITRQSGYPQLYVWGSHAIGQLGLGKLNDQNSFVDHPVALDLTGDLDPSDERIVGIYAGYSQSAVLRDASTSRFWTPTPKNEIYLWGLNNTYQLAQQETTSRYEPVQIKGFYDGYFGKKFLPIESIAFGNNHILIQSSKGLLASAGDNSRGQLGYGEVVNATQLTQVTTTDLIRPRWLSNQTIHTSWKDGTILRLKWPEAQDNTAVAGYWVEITTPGQEPVVYDAGLSTAISVPNLQEGTPVQIVVYVYDAYSKEVYRPELGHLTGYVLPDGQSISAYFVASAAVTAPIDLDRHNWQPDPSGHRQAPEVPWSIESIQNKQKILGPYAPYMVGASILVLLMITASVSQHRRTKRKQLLVEVEAESEIEAS